MAALLEGKLAPRELAETTAHLRDCADCRTILGESARFEAEEESGRKATMPARHRFRFIAAAAAAVALLVPAARWLQYRTSPLGVLVAAAPREHRPTLARVSRYPYAPPPAGPRGGPGESPEQLQLKGAAGQVIERTQKLDTVNARHAEGVAHLLIGQTPQSVELLQRAAEQSRDARVWNDLAAALYTVGEERSDSYKNALAAADRAIELDPELAEAHFNRALILEKMNLPAEAAWKRYLELDPSSEWSNEARKRLQALPKKSGASDPAEHRRKAEGVLLGEWADAELRGDGAAKLAELRAAAKHLVAVNGDALLADTVATIERADGLQRRALAQAHQLYRDARKARHGFERAEAALRKAGSPMADSAAYYAAVVQFDRNQHSKAAPALSELSTRVDAQRHRSLAAGIHMALANCATVSADWGMAYREATFAAAAFERLGEMQNAAYATAASAQALERMGASNEAWKQWVHAFGRTQDARNRSAMVHFAGMGLAAMQQHDAAEALIDVVRDDLRQNPVTAAAAFTERARAALHAGQSQTAIRWLRDARDAAARIEKPEDRALAEAQLDLAEGVQRISTDPRAALAELDRAITFFGENKQRIFLADAYLQRGRARRAAGDDQAALADYALALREVETQRGARKISFTDTAEQIIDETVELHLDRRDVHRAFAIADRAHASLATSPIAAIPEGTALVEYVLLPRRLAIFCLTREGLTAVTVSIGRRELAQRVASLAAGIRARRDEQEIRAAAASLHRVLVAPLQATLANIDELVFVADRELQSLPFAALVDGERYLVQRFAIRYAPSAAHVDRPVERLTPAVAFADPAAAGWPSLPWSREEAQQVAEVHGAAIVAGAEATPARFLESLRRSALVHYAGHADSNAGTHGALLLASSGKDSGILVASDIARLSLHERAPLVVLSACGTLRGETRHVAGMPTLARAFLTAGARAVVGTQWEVHDDLTTPLFVHFHQKLHAGQAPARALRSAQMAMLQTPDPRFRHPAAWSAVALLSNV